MTYAVLATAVGFVLLLWSANLFVEGCAATARHIGVPVLLIGIVVVGFGTSSPELLISGLAAVQGNPGLALGNAYGSNIINIALVLGVAALIMPVEVHSQVLRKELPVLMGVTALAAVQLWDHHISRADAWVLLGVFAVVMGWLVAQATRERADTLGAVVELGLATRKVTLAGALWRLAAGLVVLVASSWLLVEGAVGIARGLGVSDLIIGLTIVAVGTSLPELASALVAARKGEHDLAVGNIVGSNLFNTLAVVGIAGAIHPMQVDPDVLLRDLPMMAVLTVALFAICYGFYGSRCITRLEGALLLMAYVGYTAVVIVSVV